jgi:hypothetical protein
MLPRIRSNSFFYLSVLYYAGSINEWHLHILVTLIFWHPLMFQHSLSLLFGPAVAVLYFFLLLPPPLYTAVESLLLQMFFSNVSVVLAVNGLPSFDGMYLLLLTYPAVAGSTTIVNTPFVIGFSTNSGVPAVGCHPLMFHLSLVLLPVLQLLFFLVLLFHPWVSCGESLCCGCRLYCC